jgi:hypothetical protein
MKPWRMGEFSELLISGVKESYKGLAKWAKWGICLELREMDGGGEEMGDRDGWRINAYAGDGTRLCPRYKIM